ncbi:spore germination protein GerPC [Paenibacillus ferrarius]|uniref:spore germination protein GerPC n=1 Tax=Paenibacillus ferrarius TaxID=1469647 RepID=UPI003D2D302B
MYDANAYQHFWICRFEQKIAMLEEKQCELSEENRLLREHLLISMPTELREQLKAQLKEYLDAQVNDKITKHIGDQKNTAPQNITYKIQELHVNELKGTLNIGLTSTASTDQLGDMIEKLKTDQGYNGENLFFSQEKPNS